MLLRTSVDTHLLYVAKEMLLAVCFIVVLVWERFRNA